MTATELVKNLHRTGEYRINGLAVSVEVVDARLRFGEMDFKITPLNGTGEIWTRASGVKLH